MVLPLAIASVLAFACTMCGVAVVRRMAERRAILDLPNARSSHSRPIPRGGGLAIVLVSAIGLAAWWLLFGGWSSEQLGTFLAATAIVAAVSARDDLRPLSTSARLAVHCLAAVLIVGGIGWWHRVELPGMGAAHLGWIGLPLTVVWLVGLTNAYNFMDGIDGMAAGQAIVAGGGWVVLGALGGQPMLAAAGALLGSSALGFLVHNAPPARIFMGDVGAAFLGMAFGTLAVLASVRSADLALGGMLVVWPFVFDTALTFLRRLSRRERVFEAHRSHLYQRLVIAGWSHGRVSAIYAGLALLGTLAAIVSTALASSSAGLAPLTVVPASLALVVLVRSREKACGHATATNQPDGSVNQL